MPDEGIFTPDQIRSLAASFQQSRVLLTAVELDLFTQLGRQLLTSSEAANKLGTDEHATDRLMNALVALGFLRKVHGKFYNTETAANYLVRGSAEFMGNLLHTNNMWNSWSTLTEAVHKGTSVHEFENLSSGNWLETFIDAMHYRAEREAKIISLMIDFTGVKKMLDVGGGSGAFSFEFVSKNPGMISVVFDLPEVIKLTKRYAEKYSLEEKIDYIEGDYLKDGFGTGCDLILLSQIVHINNYEQNKFLIKKCADALSNGGQIIIKDFVMNEDRTSPAIGALFALNMLVATECGDTFTEKEMKEWFEKAGIKKITRKNTSYGSDLIIGKK
ncbi:MAG: acetylserotonin O-methyltransferase [Ignavibacteriales bacterium]|nr:acetylserotonin O-methyltransferase [Ignavibacteriales bacterium]